MSSDFGPDPASRGQSVPDKSAHGQRRLARQDDLAGDGAAPSPVQGRHVRVEPGLEDGCAEPGGPRGDSSGTVRGRHVRLDLDGDGSWGKHVKGARAHAVGTAGRHARAETVPTQSVTKGRATSGANATGGQADRRRLLADDDATGTATGSEVRPSLRTRLRGNQLVSNSLLLMFNSGLQALAGFVFWIISARLFSVADVGLATSLLSALGIVAFTSLLGLNSTVVRYLPRSKERNILITAAMVMVAACGATLTIGFLAIIPAVSPKLTFVTQDAAMAAGVVLLGGIFGPLNLITDSVFIGLRQARFNVVVDGGIGGTVKIAAAVVVAGAGAYGLFVAAAIGYAAAAVASVALLVAVNRYRPTLRGVRAVLRPMWRFSGANYAGTLLTLLPTFLIPLIVLDRLGVHASAYYYIAFQIVGLLFAGVFAVEQAFLSEGSHEESELRVLMRRSWRLLVLFCVPASVVLALGARWLLLLFGRTYSVHGTDVLIVLATATLPFGIFNWLLTVLRLIGRLSPIVAGNLVYAVLTCGLAWILAPRGVVALAAAWPIGLTAASAALAVPVWRWARLSRRGAPAAALPG